jgi:hypothetical protein
MSNEINTILIEKGKELFITIINDLMTEPYNFSVEDIAELIQLRFTSNEERQLIIKKLQDGLKDI